MDWIGDATILEDLESAGRAVAGAAGRLAEDAGRLKMLVDRACALKDVPESSAANRHWRAGLRRWLDAAETLAACGAEATRAANALDAGTDEFLRAAGALRARGPEPSS